MNIIDIISSIALIICIVVLNVYLWTRHWEKIGGSTKTKLLGCTVILILLSFLFWSFTYKQFIIAIITLVFSFANLCFLHKKNWGRMQYTLIFIFLSTFYILWLTVLFGKFYYDNELIDISLYMNQVEDIIDKYDWYLFPIYDFQLSIIFFDIGLEKYFTLPKQLSLSNIQFIQFLIGIIINGTIVFSVFDLIKSAIAPNTNIEINQNRIPYIEISSVKLYSNGINKVYTKHFYKSMNYNFGIDLSLKNNFSQNLKAKIYIYVHNSINEYNSIANWEEEKMINENDSITCNYEVSNRIFSEMQVGKYIIRFCINGKIVKKESFTVSYK